MYDLWVSEPEAKGGAGPRDGVTPNGTIFHAILSRAVGRGPSQILSSIDPSFIPLTDVTMETRDDESASVINFAVERDAAGEDVGACQESRRLPF